MGGKKKEGGGTLEKSHRSSPLQFGRDKVAGRRGAVEVWARVSPGRRMDP